MANFPPLNYRLDKDPDPFIRGAHKFMVYLFGILFLLAILGAAKNAAYGQEMEFKIAPEPAHPGDLVIFEVKGTLPASPHIGWLGDRHVSLFWHKDRLIGFAAIPLDQKPGEIEVSVSVYAEGNRWLINLKKELTIKSAYWPERRVGETPPLSPKKLARYLKEKALIKKSLETTADAPLWQDRFLPAFPTAEETSPFGQKRIGPTKTRQHRGVDLRAAVGTPVRSMNSGRVVLTGNFLADGKIVIIDHGLGLHTLYLHLSRIKVKGGQFVKRGQIIGSSGNTGFSEGPHLHLEVRLGSEAVSPLQILELIK